MFFHRMFRLTCLSNRTQVGIQIKMSRDIHLTMQARVLIVNLSGVICPVTFSLVFQDWFIVDKPICWSITKYCKANKLELKFV